MKIKINPLTVILFFMAWLTGNISVLAVAYAVMAAHECAHLIAALCIGLRPESMTFSPFGVHLELKNRLVRSLADEIIVYSAGPLVNALLALAALYTCSVEFYRINTALLVMNLLPVAPLDGGIILKRIISYKYGALTSQRIMKGSAVILSTVLMCTAVISLCYGIINLSAFTMALFLLGNLITAKELYNVDFINAVSHDKKNTNKARLVIVDGRHKLIDAAKTITPSQTTIAAVFDDDGRLVRFMTEKEIIEKLTM
ncbi:MAG: site-2 protease family protein [Candidatus Ornithomonoglobus sp.]